MLGAGAMWPGYSEQQGQVSSALQGWRMGGGLEWPSGMRPGAVPLSQPRVATTDIHHPSPGFVKRLIWFVMLYQSPKKDTLA